MSDTVVFPHEEIDGLLDTQFYLPDGLTPWNTPCTLNDATGNVKLDITPVSALTRPFDGDKNLKAHMDSVELLFAGNTEAAQAAITGNGIYCVPTVNGSEQSGFYVSQQSLTEQPTVAGMIYAQSQIEPMATDGKRTLVYWLMTESPQSGGILWRFKIRR